MLPAILVRAIALSLLALLADFLFTGASRRNESRGERSALEEGTDPGNHWLTEWAELSGLPMGSIDMVLSW